MKAIEWLRESVVPLWLAKGLDVRSGAFAEALSFKEGSPLPLARRALVQARQIYSFRMASELGVLEKDKAREIIAGATEFLLKYYSLPTGGFIHSVSPEGFPENKTPELYTQAFALFGLAHSYAVNQVPALETRALDLAAYLSRERALPGGGFSELAGGQIQYEANPHMHLFEAAIAWMEVSSDPVWRRLADHILDLCLKRFIDPVSGALYEHFNEKWLPIVTEKGSVMEPGHLFEWSWLMAKYEALTGFELGEVRGRLFNLAEQHGISLDEKLVYDELWGDFSPKMTSSRFWTQCERIKCAANRGEAAAATEAMQSLQRYFATPVAGMWFDRVGENGAFLGENAKASSLYHIIGAIAEYQQMS